VGDRFRRIADAAQLPALTIRQLRHSHATALLAAGMPPKVVQERLGHASISITMNIYSAVLPGMQWDAVEKLAAIIG
jgi:integrase